jgi:hypothetical protein
VEGLAFQGAENHHLEGAGEEVALLGFLHAWGRSKVYAAHHSA